MKKQTTPKQIPTIATIIRGYGLWQHPIAVVAALCQDGVRRKVRLNEDGETGRCTIKKRTLKGHVTHVPNSKWEPGTPVDYQFIAWNEQ